MRQSLDGGNAHLSKRVLEQQRNLVRRGVVVQAAQRLAGVVAYPSVIVAQRRMEPFEHGWFAGGMPERSQRERARARRLVLGGPQQLALCPWIVDEGQAGKGCLTQLLVATVGRCQELVQAFWVAEIADDA